MVKCLVCFYLNYDCEMFKTTQKSILTSAVLQSPTEWMVPTKLSLGKQKKLYSLFACALLLSAFNTLSIYNFSYCCRFYCCSYELVYHVGGQTLSGQMTYFMCILWMVWLLLTCHGSRFNGTHTHIRRSASNQSKLFSIASARASRSLFLFGCRSCHMCVTLSGCFISTVATGALSSTADRES